MRKIYTKHLSGDYNNSIKTNKLGYMQTVYPFEFCHVNNVKLINNMSRKSYLTISLQKTKKNRLKHFLISVEKTMKCWKT